MSSPVWSACGAGPRNYYMGTRARPSRSLRVTMPPPRRWRSRPASSCGSRDCRRCSRSTSSRPTWSCACSRPSTTRSCACSFARSSASRAVRISRWERTLLIADLSRAPREKLEAARAAGRREALLAGALLCFARWDAHMEQQQQPMPIDETRPPPPQTPRVLPAAVVQVLSELDGTVLLTARAREPLLELGARPVLHVAVRLPTPSPPSTLMP